MNNANHCTQKMLTPSASPYVMIAIIVSESRVTKKQSVNA